MICRYFICNLWCWWLEHATKKQLRLITKSLSLCSERKLPRDCRFENCHIARSSSQLGSCGFSDVVFIISPPPTVGTLPDFLLASAVVNPFVSLPSPLYSGVRTKEPWPFINTLSLRSISSRIDGKKSINFLYWRVDGKKRTTETSV